MSKVPITVQYRSTLSGVSGWVGEVITSIQRYLWQHEYGHRPYVGLQLLSDI